MMKREYKRPELVEYGRLEQVTLGSGNLAPDVFPNFTPANSNCTDPNAVLCVVPFPS